MTKKRLTLHYIQVVDMLRKCHHVCLLISSIIVWVLWTSRCRRVFQQIKWNVVEVVKEIGGTLVHTRKGEYDAIKGDLDVAFRKQEALKKRWEIMKVFYMVNGGICW